jgi:hypothetical protein
VSRSHRTDARLDPVAASLVDRSIDDLLLDVRGLALVRGLLSDRGASAAEIDAHSRALERARAQLAEAVGGRARAELEAA